MATWEGTSSGWGVGHPGAGSKTEVVTVSAPLRPGRGDTVTAAAGGGC